MINDIKDITSFKWATVTGTSPLAIRLDGDTNPLALVPDSLVDPLSLSVGDRVRVELSLRKVVIHGESNGGVFAGKVEITATPTAPTGWLLCQGQSLLRSAYPRLFAAIGTTYGAVDSTHFSLPDGRGRTIYGYDGADSYFYPLGVKSGEKTHLLTAGESGLPQHYHNYVAGGAFVGTGNGSGNVANWVGTGSQFQYYPSTDWAGPANAAQAHNNMPPYIVMNYIIKI